MHKATAGVAMRSNTSYHSFCVLGYCMHQVIMIGSFGTQGLSLSTSGAITCLAQQSCLSSALQIQRRVRRIFSNYTPLPSDKA